MVDWSFTSEFGLEEFLWAHLAPLLTLTPLARQYIIKGQVCDILAVTANRQLAILELKNEEDRYVVPQLTRYYASIKQEQPFPDQVDYRQPIKLIAIAPSFHLHNEIDRTYSRLSFDFWRFQVHESDSKITFHLHATETDQPHRVAIPPDYHGSLRPGEPQDNLVAPSVPSRPPKSLRLLLDALEPEQQDYVLALREKILEFDESMAEVGRTVRTQYGLRKGGSEIFKKHLCAELILERFQQFKSVSLSLMLPYPKREFKRRTLQGYVKGFTLARVPLLPSQWQQRKPIAFRFGRSRRMTRFEYNLAEYSKLYENLSGRSLSIKTTTGLVDVALYEWRENLSAAGVLSLDEEQE